MESVRIVFIPCPSKNFNGIDERGRPVNLSGFHITPCVLEIL